MLVLGQHDEVPRHHGSGEVDLLALDEQVEARGIHIADLDVLLPLAQHQIGQGQTSRVRRATVPGLDAIFFGGVVQGIIGEILKDAVCRGDILRPLVLQRVGEGIEIVHAADGQRRAIVRM